MARYFFNTRDGIAHRDELGTELESDAAARVEAIVYAGEVMANEPDVVWDGREFQVRVSDERGALLIIVSCHVIDGPEADVADQGRSAAQFRHT